MTVDPSDPETFEGEPDVTEIDVEVPEADAAQQHADISPHCDDRFTDIAPDSGNEADRAEQARVVELNEDEYR